MKGSFTVPDMSEQGLLQVKLVLQTYHQRNFRQKSNISIFQLQLSRATPALLFVYMVAMTGVGMLGLTGCWQQSANKLIWTAAIQVTKENKNKRGVLQLSLHSCWQLFLERQQWRPGTPRFSWKWRKFTNPGFLSLGQTGFRCSSTLQANRSSAFRSHSIKPFFLSLTTIS